MQRSLLETAPMSEVLTRVTYQLIVLRYRSHPETFRTNPAIGILVYANLLHLDGFAALGHMATTAAGALAADYTLADWRDRITPKRHQRAIRRLTAKRPR